MLCLAVPQARTGRNGTRQVERRTASSCKADRRRPVAGPQVLAAVQMVDRPAHHRGHRQHGADRRVAPGWASSPGDDQSERARGRRHRSRGVHPGPDRQDPQGAGSPDLEAPRRPAHLSPTRARSRRPGGQGGRKRHEEDDLRLARRDLEARKEKYTQFDVQNDARKILKDSSRPALQQRQRR